MTIQNFIYQVLANDNAISKKVGNRIYPLFVPAAVSSYPAIIYNIKKNRAIGTKDGDSKLVTITLSTIAKTYDAAVSIAVDIWRAFTDLILAQAEQYGFERWQWIGEKYTYRPELDADMVSIDTIIQLEEWCQSDSQSTQRTDVEDIDWDGMMIQNFIYKVLTNDTAVYAAIGNRVYPMFIPSTAAAFPVVVYTLDKELGQGTKDGEVRHTSVTFTIISKGYDAAHELAGKIWNAISNDTIRTVADSIGFENWQWQSETDMYLPDMDPTATVVNLVVSADEWYPYLIEEPILWDNNTEILWDNGVEMVFIR